MSNPAAIAVSELNGSQLTVKVLTQQLRDHHSVQGLRSVIDQGLKGASVTDLILDLHDVKMIGSVAFLAMLGVRRDHHLDHFFVSGMSQGVKEVFTICKMLRTPANPEGIFEEAA
jgi:anti-anti-sigma regulatory factor